jgi:beta-mannosidase
MFQALVFLLLLCFSNANRISLSGNDWMITDNGNYTAQGSIPGTVHTILLAANKIPDPYLGYNDVNLRFLVRKDWVFSKNFTLTPDFLASNNVSIHLEQIDTVANITINRCLIGKTNNMFLRYVFPIPSPCLHAENVIQIDFQSPITYALEQSIAYNVTVPPLCPPVCQHGECLVQFIRKEPCSFSWDWV